MRSWIRIGALSLAAAIAGAGSAQVPLTVDCSIDGQHLTCSREILAKRFAEAKTVEVESTPKSKSAEALLRSKMTQLGKQIAPQGATADITLHLFQTPQVGVDTSSGDSELATLRVLSSKPGQQQLLWVERYRGRADTPWPSVVQLITQQFQASLAGE